MAIPETEVKEGNNSYVSCSILTLINYRENGNFKFCLKESHFSSS